MAVAPATLETSTAPPPAEPLLTLAPEDIPNVEDLVTEDDTPVDNMFSAKQQRLLIESLQISWAGPGAQRPFVADANVGVFYALHQPPLVPDAFLSLDVHLPPEVWEKRHRSYFLWEYGKPPEVVVEVVSNRKGGETTRKLPIYARIGVIYAVVFDPLQQLGPDLLQVYELHAGVYRKTPDTWLAQAGLGVTLWHGMYEDLATTWLRWCDRDGRLIATGWERSEQARQQAAQAQQQAEQARQQAEQAQQQTAQARQQAAQAQQQAEQARQQTAQAQQQVEQARQQTAQAQQQVEQARQQVAQERQRAERLEARLRALGIEPCDT